MRQGSQTRSIFQQRFKDTWKKGLRYFILISSNGGMPILLLLAAILFVHAYTVFLRLLPETFPAFLLMAFVISIVLTKSAVRTFIRQPDMVFLLPLEHGMSGYFRNSLTYSTIVQALYAISAMALLLPLYRIRIGDEVDFLVALAIVVLFKWWNVYASWQEMRLSRGRGTHVAFRFIVNFVMMALLFYQGSVALYILIAAIMLSVTTFYYSRLVKKDRYPWYRLVDVEQKRRNALYTLTSFFIDVPHLQQRVKERPWLSRLLQRLPYGQQNSILYLYSRTFIRSGESFGMYVRLSMVMAILIVLIPNTYVVFAAYILGLIFTGVQLPPISKKHSESMWLKLYPLQPHTYQRSLSRLVFALLAFQSVLLALVSLLRQPSMPLLAALLAGGLIFSYAFSHMYLPKKRFFR